ncbi:hypothetical protein RRG08_063431 [Elysia crispata]|uniref:DNA polymerase n=1 Tax=Elysia crispata TaxID=231223 RepID=A0AAE1A9F9_9GAST|nr:hypothetical protein RRG08_063431 [Elysia crispata]
MSAKAAETSHDDNDDGTTSLAKGRSRRQKVDKKGRLSAFEKLREAKEKGLKNKYEIQEEQNVYDVVEEQEYSDLVRQRQEDDWIVDDDGGYVEDGREIFDDEMDESAPVRPGQKKADGKKKNKNIVRPGTKPKQDIKSMFAAAAVSTKRKPEKEVSLAGDDILDSLMGELSKGSSAAAQTSGSLGKGSKGVKKPAYNPFQVDKSSKSTPPLKATAANSSKSIKRELLYASEQSEKRKKRGADSEDWTKVKLKQEIKETSTEQDAPVEVQIKEEPDDPAVCDDLSGIDFDDEDQMLEAYDTADVKMEVQESKAARISEDQLSMGWENVGVTDVQPSSDIKVDNSHLPLVSNSAGEQVMQFYWLDAFEDAYKQPGVVYLFGKVYIDTAKSHVSCCVTVKNIERRIFILPRVKRVNLKTCQELSEEVTMPMVHEEFSKIAEKFKIDQFRAMKVKKKYAFEMMDVPVEADYLEIRYSADLPVLVSELKGETFSHVFGTKTSSLELLLLNRKMKGPAWLDLKCPQVSTAATSWCKLEAVISKPEHISVSDVHLAPPPLTVMTLNLQTLPNPKTKQNEIVAAACLLHTDFHMDKPAPKQTFQHHFCVMTKPSDCIFPFDFKDQVKRQATRFTVDIMPNERALIGFLLAKIHRFDPDLLVGHDIYGFDLDVLLHRISANKIPHWSKISRLKRTLMPKLSHGHGRSSFAEKTAVCGRIMCDVQISARELIRCRSYDLTVLTSDVLKLNRLEVDYDEVKAMFQSSADLLKLIELTLQDSHYILRIMYELNVIPLALQITSICGNIMSRTLLSGRSERNEWLLLHAFHEKQYICPDKEYKKKQTPVLLNEDDEELDQGGGKKTQGRRKPAYSGGLVLEPKKGFYDTYILLLDFNSLYPSIIQEYNICFTTISRSEKVNQMTEEEDEANLILPDPDLEPGVLPVEIRKLVESRKQVKKLMKGSDISPEQMMQYDIRQKALKLTANSMYGCLGFSFSRFYAKPLAALVTGKGREILMKTKDLVQGMNLDVIYGDTDSIMINTNSTDLDTVFKLGNKVKMEVNKLYRLLEIDIDGVFKSMLLLKKKKYAALSISRSSDGKETQVEERKGLDIVRRDWCDLAKNAGSFVVSTILSGKSREVTVEEIHTKLQKVAEEVREGKISQELFHITKQLTKNPKDYPDSKSLPHVQVAMRYNSKGGKEMRAGDTVPYIICEDGSTMSATQRAYHPEELAKQTNLKIDTKYYLAHQIHPVVARLCDPIDGTDSARIAECLGLDPSGYRQSVRAEEDDEEDLVTVQLTIEERFRDSERFTFNCPAPTCGRQVVLDAPFIGNDASLTPALQSCPNKECRYPLWESKTRLKNMLQRNIQQHVNRYYQGWLRCEDTVCGARTNRMPLIMQRGHPVCPSCNRGYLHPEYSDCTLYTQLCFYEHIFDVPKASTYLNDVEKGVLRKVNNEVQQAYRELKIIVTRWLDRSAYSNVDLGKLFQGLGLMAPQVTPHKIKVEREM